MHGRLQKCKLVEGTAVQGSTGVSQGNSSITANTQVDGPVASLRAVNLQKCKSPGGASVAGAGGPHTQEWEREQP